MSISKNQKLVQQVLDLYKKKTTFKDIKDITKSTPNEMYGIFNYLVEMKIITPLEYKKFKETSRKLSGAKLRLKVWDRLKKGIPIVEVAKEIGCTRQNIYLHIDWLVKNDLITIEEKVKVLENVEKTRTPKDDKKDKLKKLLNDGVDEFSILKRNFKDVNAITLRNYLHELLEEGFIKENLYDKIGRPRMRKINLKRESVIKKLPKDISEKYTVNQLLKKYDLTFITFKKYVDIAFRENKITEHQYKLVNQNGFFLDDSDKVSMRIFRYIKNGKNLKYILDNYDVSKEKICEITQELLKKKKIKKRSFNKFMKSS